MNKREKLFSVTLKDCEVQPYRGSGAGGQKRNKTSSAIRCAHAPSGAVGQCEEHREQILNKRTAFKRMSETKKFKDWMRIEASRKMGHLAKINNKIDEDMKKVKIETKNEKGLWEENKEI